MSEDRIAALERRVSALEVALATNASSRIASGNLPESQGRPNAPVGGEKEPPWIAPDRVLDSDLGDPVVFRDPNRGWTGPSYEGKRYSECPPEYLDALCNFLNFKMEMNRRDGKLTRSGASMASVIGWDLAKARGWAKRLRERGQRPQSGPTPIDQALGPERTADDFPESWK